MQLPSRASTFRPPVNSPPLAVQGVTGQHVRARIPTLATTLGRGFFVASSAGAAYLSSPSRSAVRMFRRNLAQGVNSSLPPKLPSYRTGSAPVGASPGLSTGMCWDAAKDGVAS